MQIDSTFQNDFKNVYAPSIDLVIKIILGIFVAIWLARRGFKYKIKEKLYDLYVELVEFASTGEDIQKSYLKSRIVEYILSYNFITSSSWEARLKELSEYYTKQNYSDKLYEYLIEFGRRIDTIRLYLGDGKYSSDVDERLWKVNLYYYALLHNDKMEKSINDFYLSHKETPLYLLSKLEVNRATLLEVDTALSSFYNAVVGQIRAEFVKADRSYSPFALLDYIKGKVSSF